MGIGIVYMIVGVSELCTKKTESKAKNDPASLSKAAEENKGKSDIEKPK